MNEASDWNVNWVAQYNKIGKDCVVLLFISEHYLEILYLREYWAGNRDISMVMDWIGSKKHEQNNMWNAGKNSNGWCFV